MIYNTIFDCVTSLNDYHIWNQLKNLIQMTILEHMTCLMTKPLSYLKSAQKSDPNDI